MADSMEKNKLITNMQSGFCKQRSTIDNLVRLETFIRKAFVQKQHAVARAGSRIWVWRGPSRAPPPQKIFIFWSQNAYFCALSGPSRVFLQRNTSRSIPALCLPALTFQADCGSIKGAGVSAEEGTEHYLPW